MQTEKTRAAHIKNLVGANPEGLSTIRVPVYWPRIWGEVYRPVKKERK